MRCRYKVSGTGMHVGHLSGRDVKVDLSVFTVKGEQFLFYWVRQLEVAVELTVENSVVQMSNSIHMAALKNKLSPIHNPVHRFTVDIIMWQFSRHCPSPTLKCVYVCIHIYIHTYIHTHTFLQMLIMFYSCLLPTWEKANSTCELFIKVTLTIILPTWLYLCKNVV